MAANDDRPGRDRPSSDQHPDLLTRLSRLNPTAVVMGAVLLFLVVLFLPDPVGGVLILLLAGALAALLTRTWPVLPGQQRVLRVIVIGLLVTVAVSKLL
jgi:hypothetical protein